MKSQRLVSSYTPSAIQEWLEQELEKRGIDSVYARSILSLLQQDYVDVEPHECHQTRNRQLKVLHKYGGPENSYYATKSKHQKWKTWGKQILLTSTPPCCKAAYYDLERILKKAAIDCLKSASDYVDDVEKLIDEVWLRLKNKSLNDQEEMAIRKCNTLGQSFFIPPSSPTDDMEKYFASFPPLSSNTELAVKSVQPKVLKNDWCKKCILKRKSKVQNEEAHNSENQNIKSVQPIIPYRSLKTIKTIFKNTDTKSSHLKATCTAQKSLVGKSSAYETKYFKAFIKNLVLPFDNLSLIYISKTPLNKNKLLDLLKNSCIQNLFLSMSGTTYTVKSYALKNSNEPPSQVLPKKLYSVSISYRNSYSLNQCVSQILIREKNVSEQQRNQDINCLKISFSSDLESKSPLRGKDFSKSSFNNRSLKGSTFKQSDSFDFNPHIAASSLSAFYKESKPIFKKETVSADGILHDNHIDTRSDRKYYLSAALIDKNYSHLKMLKSSKVNNSQNSELCIRDVNESDSFKTTTAIFEENIHNCNKSYEDCFDADTSQLHSNSSVFIAKNSSGSMNKLSTTNQSFDLSHTPGASFNTDYSYEQHMDYKFMPSNELENNTYDGEIYYSDEEQDEKNVSISSGRLLPHISQNCSSLDIPSKAIFHKTNFKQSKHIETKPSSCKFEDCVTDNKINLNNHLSKISLYANTANLSSSISIFHLILQNYFRSNELPGKTFPSADADHNKVAEIVPCSELESNQSDEEIYYSDEESNEIYFSDNKKICDFSETHMQTLPFNELLGKTFLSGDTEQNKDKVMPSTKSSYDEDEVYYSDEDSTEMHFSSNKDNLHLSSVQFLPSLSLTNKLSNQTFPSTKKKNIISSSNCMSNINRDDTSFNTYTKEKTDLYYKLNNKSESGQKMLKKVLGIGGNNVVNSIRSESQSLSYEEESLMLANQSKSVDKSITMEKTERHKHFQNVEVKTKSELNTKSSCYSEPNYQNSFVLNTLNSSNGAINEAEISDKKWLLYWGRNHNFIVRTWQKDFDPFEEIKNNNHVYDAKISTTQEDGEILNSHIMPPIGEAAFENMSSTNKYKQDNLHSNSFNSSVGSFPSSFEERTTGYLQVPNYQNLDDCNGFNEVPDNNTCVPTANNFFPSSVQNKVPDMQAYCQMQTTDQVDEDAYIPVVDNNYAVYNDQVGAYIKNASDYPVSYEDDSLKAANYPNLSAFSIENEDNSFKDQYAYAEGGGWSLATDNEFDSYNDNQFERSSSLNKLDLETSNTGFFGFDSEKRPRCISETNNMELSKNDAQNHLYKQTKQKFETRKRPCCFFLQGTCTRNNCQYSHDLSTITCRFWKEGSCFKGLTCPFLHGYSKENDKGSLKKSCLKSRSSVQSYSLDSETDFPSLSSNK